MLNNSNNSNWASEASAVLTRNGHSYPAPVIGPDPDFMTEGCVHCSNSVQIVQTLSSSPLCRPFHFVHSLDGKHSVCVRI